LRRLSERRPYYRNRPRARVFERDKTGNAPPNRQPIVVPSTTPATDDTIAEATNGSPRKDETVFIGD
jgi:hypothetical protein